MTRLLLALLVLAAAPASLFGAGLPQLVIKGRDFTKSLPLAEATLSVEFEGQVAEIIYEIAYQNDTDQRHEGEFSLQLPPGATVSTYAIDVRGEMRPAVSVEKERARNAYESIKRRMVDPGIVERGADNTYRTRVFPIEPRSVKRVRIGYLREVGLDETLELPLDCEGKVGRFELILRNMREFPEFRNFTAPERTRLDSRTMSWLTGETELTGALVLPPFSLKGSSESLRVEGAPGGVRHFVAQGDVSDAVAGRESWSKVRVIWDASYSGRFRDHEAELAALDRIWKWLGEARVSARILDTELSAPFEFSLTGGDGRALRDSLEKVSYDGAVDFSKLDAFDGITLIVSDGRVSSPLWAPPKRTGGPVFLLKGGAGPASPWLLAAIDAEINLHAQDFAAELETHRDPVVIEGLDRSEWCFVRTGRRYRVTGILPPDVPASLRLRGGGIGEREFATATTHGQEEWNFTRRLWAQDRLNDLEWQRDRERIEEHAMAERLASDFTSLIVLERMEDHLRYRIPPPEPDLLTEYRERLLPQSNRLSGNAFFSWNGKLRWYRTDYPWIDTELREEIATVAIFTKAAREVFPAAAIETSSIPKLEAWIPGAGATVTSAGAIKTDDAYRAWQAEAKSRFEALAGIRNENELQTPKGVFPVSVRGFVLQRGIVEGESPFALRDAVGKSGGVSGYGSLARVFLYRDGQRTGYNLESLQADPVHLRPCDMIVVESSPRASYLSWDGFADPFSGPMLPEPRPAASGGAPIFETPGQARPSLPPTANPARSANGRRETSESSFLETPAPPPAAKGSDVEFLAALHAAADPEAHYREALAGPFGKEPVAAATILEAARFLYFKGKPTLAWRVLTTLGELEPNPIEATRALAFWLVEFGDRERAARLLDSLLEAVPDQATRSLVRHDLARITGNRRQFLEAANDDLGSEEKDSLAPVVLTDFFQLGGRASGLAGTFPPLAMPSDLRLVISCAGGGASLEVATPGRPQFRGGDGFGAADEGAWRLDHPRILEYQIRRALPGTYQPSLVRWSESGGPLTVRVDAWLRWGKENEEHRSFTLLLDRNQLELPALGFGWGDGK